MNPIQSVSQPIVAFLTEHAWRPLNALETKTKWLALALFVGLGLGLGAYSIYRLRLKERNIIPLPSNQTQIGHQGPPVVVPPPASTDKPVVDQVLKPNSKSLDTMQACYQGKDFFLGKIEEEHFQKTLGIFQTYRKNPHHQKDEQGRSNPMVIHLGHDFAQANGLGVDSEHSSMFVRYLVLEGVGVAYRQNGIDHYLYLDRAAVPRDPARVYTKERLLDIHQKLEALSFPSLDNYSTEERPLAEEILRSVKESYYYRFHSNVQKVSAVVMNLNENPLACQVLDKLVSQCSDLIYAWNAQKLTTSTFVMLQLKKEDPIADKYKDAQWSVWRDKDIVEVENEIKDDERTKVDRRTLSGRYLAFADKLQLIRFIEKLKTRTSGNRVGVWFADNHGWVLYHLRARGDIYSYVLDDEEFKGWKRNFCRICITKEDYDADVKQQSEECKKFRDENRIVITEDTLKKSKWTSFQQEKALELIGDLNQRGTWGAYSWDCELAVKGGSILEFLQDQELIHRYDKTKRDRENEYFKIYVKSKDYYGP